MIKKIAVILMAVVMIVAFAACSMSDPQAKVHKIGVAVYDLYDEQVMAFREYLENYIAPNFGNVQFLYSKTIASQDEMMKFLQSCADEGVEGIMAFNSYDLPKEVEFCASHKMYIMRPAATISVSDYQQISSNPYFLGSFGPGEAIEYSAGKDMGAFFGEKKETDNYFIVSGGSGMNNVMHSRRTEGILDGLTAAYGVKFSKTNAELSKTAEPVTVEAGGLKVTIAPGYMMEPFISNIKAEYLKNPADTILAVIPLGEFLKDTGNAKLGIIDCYTENNHKLFESGRLQYLTGKYSSIIGPAFAAMYNAVTGHAEDFRYNGNAFSITQGFWTSTNDADFEEKYTLSNGIALNAYAYTDLLQVVKDYNENASFSDLKALAEAYDFESAQARVMTR